MHVITVCNQCNVMYVMCCNVMYCDVMQCNGMVWCGMYGMSVCIYIYRNRD